MAQYNLGRVQGLSAYEVAVQNGYIGTEEEWLTWIKAKNGTEVEINSELQPNVNFIRNEIVKDGLVNSFLKTNTSKSVNLTNEYTIIFEGITSDITKMSGDKVWYLFGNSGTYIYIHGSGNIVNSQGSTIFANAITPNVQFKIVITRKNDSVNVTFNGVTKPVLLSNSGYTALAIGNFSETIIEYLNNGYFSAYIYNRQLTSQEIQHNLSVLNNTPSINKINDYAISTDTDHIQDRTGRVQDTINRVFYKNNCKEFTSNGGDIVVNNGMDGYVLSGMITGQTVKNYFKGVKSYTLTSNTATFPSATFSDDLSIKMIINVLSISGEPTLGTQFNKRSYKLDKITSTGIKIIDVPSYNSAGTGNYFAINGYVEGQSIIFDVLAVVDTGNESKITSYIPFGLTSTQATISNNGLKYSFYLNNEDKLANKVIDLGGLEGARNTWELKEDGSAVYTQNSITTNVAPPNIQLISESATTIAVSLGIANVKYRYSVSTLYSNLLPSLSVYDTTLVGGNPFTQSSIASSKEFCVTWEDGKCYAVLFKSKTGNTLNDVKTFLTNNIMQLCYQLATPVVTIIPKELVPAILTQATNTFTFGEAVAPYKVTIQAPVNRIAEMQAEINEIKALIQTPSNINLTMNYIEDEYNKNQSEEGAI